MDDMPNPKSTTKNINRKLDCPKYPDCLTLASKQYWPNFTCNFCKFKPIPNVSHKKIYKNPCHDCHIHRAGLSKKKVFHTKYTGMPITCTSNLRKECAECIPRQAYEGDDISHPTGNDTFDPHGISPSLYAKNAGV